VTRHLTALLLAAAVTAAVAPVVASGSAHSARTPAAVRTVTLTKGQQIYRGTGNRSLGTLRLRRSAKFTWRHPRGGRLRVLTSGPRGLQFALVSTTFRTGSVRLRAGTYRGLRVQTSGGWRITITTLR
jgi:hypothetical protein